MGKKEKERKMIQAYTTGQKYGVGNILKIYLIKQ